MLCVTLIEISLLAAPSADIMTQRDAAIFEHSGTITHGKPFDNRPEVFDRGAEEIIRRQKDSRLTDDGIKKIPLLRSLRTSQST